MTASPVLSRRAFLYVLGGLGMSACSGGGSAAPASATGTPAHGGTVTMLVLSAPRALDPFGANYAAVSDGNRMAALYDGLFWTNPGTGAVESHIAESLTHDGDLRIWRLRLRPGVHFSDGTPFDAESIAANWRMHADPSVGSLQRNAVAGMRWKIDGPLDLTITLEQPNGNLDRLVAGRLNYVASPSTLGDRATYTDRPVGAGPYMLAERGPGREVLTRNPRYWQPGRPYADQLVILSKNDAVGASKALADGDADLTVSTVPEAIADAASRDLAVTRISLSGGQMIVFNTARRPFDDARLREAVVRSLDSESLNTAVYGGTGSPAAGIFGSASPMANLNLRPPGHDPRLAAQMFSTLAAAAPGNRLAMSMIVPDVTATVAVGEYVRSALAAYPEVDFTLEVLSIPDIADRTYVAKNFDMSLNQMWLVDPEPQIYDFLHSGGPGNISGYADKDTDAALERGRSVGDHASRRLAYTQVQLAVNRDLPVWPYQESVVAALSTKDITGINLTNDGLLRFDQLGRR